MFPAHMETHTPDPPDRFALLRQELRLRFEAHGPMHGIEGALRVLLFGLFMCLINLAARRAERGAQRQACPDGASAEPGPIDAPGDAAGRSGAGGRVAVSAAVATAAGAPVIDGATNEDCIRDERDACSISPTVPRSTPAMARTISAVDYGSPVLQAPFAKTSLPDRRKIVSISFRLSNEIRRNAHFPCIKSSIISCTASTI